MNLRRFCCINSVFILLIFSSAHAQEYILTFNVDKTSLGSTSDNTFLDNSFLQDMQNNVANFINNNRWSTQSFKNQEKIKMNIQFTMTSAPNNGVGSFQGTFQVVVSRPVYNSTYESVLMSFIDKEVQFDYTLGQQMVFNENSFTNNLTALLAFYAYSFLGIDFDSYGQNGGSPFYERMLNVVNAAQQSSYPGWLALVGGNNTRYWFSENLNNQQFQPFREAIYLYHRQGLDIMATTPDKARSNILEALRKVKKVNEVKPNSVLLRSFFNAKSKELAGIFSESTPEEKKAVVDILSEIDPTHVDTYQKILTN